MHVQVARHCARGRRGEPGVAAGGGARVLQGARSRGGGAKRPFAFPVGILLAPTSHPLTIVPRQCYNSSRHTTPVSAMLQHHARYTTTIGDGIWTLHGQRKKKPFVERSGKFSRPNSLKGGASHSSGTRMTTHSLLSHTSSPKNSVGKTGWPCPGRRNTVGSTGHSG